MQYTIKQLATLAGVTVRTLHHYDEVGLLSPSREARNDYRTYTQPDLLRLQQIMFFREIDLPLSDIKKILDSPDFNTAEALNSHKRILLAKQRRITKLIHTIHHTLKSLNNPNNMDDKKLYTAFMTDEEQQLANEARARWGDTDAYKQSQARVAKMTKSEMDTIKADNEALLHKIIEHINDAPSSDAVQKLVEQHYTGLQNFYEPTLKLYAGLAEMYIADERFSAYYNTRHPKLAQFMHDAMLYFVDSKKNS